MKLYLAAGQYVGTQADAKRLDKGYEAVEVPTDKEGLIAFLNSPWKTQPQDAGFDLIAPTAATTPAVKLQPAAPPPERWSSTATEVLSNMDSKGEADGIVEKIMTARGYPLKRYAGAVAQAFAALEGK